jgi:hypothetical protein
LSANPPVDTFGTPDGPTTPVAIVATQEHVQLRVEEADDERTPDGSVCMVTILGERTIAQSIVSHEALDDIESRNIFGDPRQLGLAAVERDPGIQGRLFALVPAIILRSEVLEDDDEDAEPWAASVPNFEAEQERAEMDPDELVPILLGHIVRFEKDRKHQEDLPSEAADILRSIVSEDKELKTIVDKMLEDLF